MNAILIGLIDEHLQGTLGAESDRSFLEQAAPEFYVVTVAEAKQRLERIFGPHAWKPEFDDICARIGFLRATNALARHKMGKPWRPARSMSS